MSFINVTELARLFKQKRRDERLSLRSVGGVTKISASTLSRIEQERGQPGGAVLSRLARWLGVPLDQLVSGEPGGAPAVIYYPNQATPDIIEAHLRADPSLTPDAARAMADVLRVIYAQVSSNSNRFNGR